MGPSVETLEPRRLLSGGVDPTFGSPTGAAFAPPGDAPFVLDSAVDSAGRIVVAGRTHRIIVGDEEETEMFVARLNAIGEPDPRWGTDGVVQGTPRGLQRADLITPLASGGYLVVGCTTDFAATGARLVKFGPRGAVDTSFGDRGVVHFNLAPQRVLELPDGDILLAGFGSTPQSPSVNLLERLNPDGRIDADFGDGGFVELNTADSIDDFVAESSRIYSASLDEQGRVLLSFYSTSSTTVGGTPAGKSAEVFLQRIRPDGSRDTLFGDDARDQRETLFEASWEAADPNPPAQPIAIARTRHDGQIVVLRQIVPGSLDPADVPPGTLLVLDSAGNETATAADLANVVPGFTVTAFPNFNSTSAGDRLMHVLADDSIILAGTKTSGSTRTPALVRLKSDLTLDTTFGTGGVMTLSSAGGINIACDIGENADGTLSVLSTAPPPEFEIERPADGARVTRLFVDDRPVVTLLRARSRGEQLRFTVSIRGVHPIDATSLDDNDLRLIDSLGGRRKLRLVDFAESDGVVTATYRVARGLLDPGTFSVVALAGQIRDDQGNAGVSRELGIFTVS